MDVMVTSVSMSQPCKLTHRLVVRCVRSSLAVRCVRSRQYVPWLNANSKVFEKRVAYSIAATSVH